MLAGTEGYSNRNAHSHDRSFASASRAETGRNNRPLHVLLAGGNRLLQESIVRLLDGSGFSVVDSVDHIEGAIRRLAERPGAFDLLIVQLLGFSDVGFFDRLAQLKRLAGHSRIVLLAWPEKDLSFLSSSFDAGIDAYLEGSLSREGFRDSLDRVAAECGVSGSK